MNHGSQTNHSHLSIVDGLVQLSFLVQSVLTEVAAEHDLSVIQLRLLGILRDREPSMRQLAQHLNLNKSSITGLIDRAERRGLVKRKIALNDRRGFNVSVTPVGMELIRAGSEEVEQRLNAAVGGLTEMERMQLTTIVGKILGSSVSSNK